AFFEVEPHRTLRRSDIVVSLGADSLHVVFRNGPRRGETGKDHLAATSEAQQKMRFNRADGDDEIGPQQMAIERNIGSPGGGPEMGEFGFISAGMIAPRD